MRPHVYYVSIDDNITQKELYQSMVGVHDIEFQGVVNKYRDPASNKRIAIFILNSVVPMIKFKKKYPYSTTSVPSGFPVDVVALYT